jgi:secreted PhoX family phosphatase
VAAAAGGWVYAALAGTRQIVRWRDLAGVDEGRFEWNTVPRAADAGLRGGEAPAAFEARPACLAVDRRGLLWIGTGPGAGAPGRGAGAAGRGEETGPGAGAGQLWVCNPASGEQRCFLIGPPLCEVAGIAWAADGRTMFVDIQHPGQAGGNSDPRAPHRGSNWPDFQPAGRPRSATVVIRRNDGGVV